MRNVVALVVVAACAVALSGARSGAAGSPAPAGLTGIALQGDAGLAWQPVTGASGYTVYRGTSLTAITTRLTAAGGTTSTTYDDTTAVNGTTYYYTVRSIVGGVESSDSTPVMVKPVTRSCSTGNPVVVENCYPGNTTWNQNNTAQIGSGGIEGYATATSVNKGESFGLKVNADDGSQFSIEIYRSGYYGGAGMRLLSTIKNVAGVRQPACVSDSSTGLLDCSNWSTSYTITTTSAWVSGVYLLRLVRQDTGADFQVLVAVRDDARTSNLVYGTSFSTYQAYNNYGGKSLYTFNSTGGTTVSGTARAVKVSFDRPFEQPRSGLRDWYTRTDYATVYWLEESGYDVSYISDTDLDTKPGLLSGHKAYISPAHEEYVSAGMRHAMESARDAGINLFFTGSNESYWKIRFENSPTSGQAGRVEVCYKTVESGGPDPSGISTSTWRDPNGANDPENALSGEMYVGDNDTTYFPLVVSAAQGSDRVFRYTGLDSQLPGTSTSIGTDLVGWEWDARVSNGFEPAGVKTLTSSPVTGNLIQGNGHNETPGSTTTMSVKYTAASGALVVATGTNHWNRGLAKNAEGAGAPDVRIQQITTNVLEDMGAVPQTPAANIQLDSPTSGRPAAPTGAAAQATGSDTVQLTWNAVPGVSGYEVYRATAPRDNGQPLGFLASPSVLTGTSFTDTGLAGSTAYYYVVTSIQNGVQSLASNEAAVTTPAAAGQPVRINSGGAAYTSSTGAAFQADGLFSGGSTYSAAGRTIAGTNDPALYQDERWGQFTYTIPVANGTYDVRFHFVELYYGTVVAGGAGKRVFGMDILNTAASPDIANLDIYAQVGANHALDKTITGVKVTNGAVTIKSVYGSADDPEVAAIEVIPEAVPPSVTDTSPADGATGVGRLTKPRVTFSRAIDPTTLTSSTLTLKTSTGTTVPATISYDPSTSTATLDAGTLAYSTTYTVTATTGITATDGTPLASATSFAFTTQAPVPPNVTAQFPLAGATAVSPVTAVQATFDKSIDPTTLTPSTFTLTPSGGSPVSATVTYDATQREATLTPVSTLATSTTYTARLTTGVAATDGTPLASAVTWTFTTAATAPAPPTVVATQPANASGGVALGAVVKATFSKPMDPTSLTNTVFTLTGPEGAVAAAISYDSATSTATLTPSAELDSNASYVASVGPNARAADGGLLGSAFTWTFTTVPPPTVLSTSPASGATFVPQSTNVTATFSRAMTASSITPSSFLLSAPDGTVVPATVTYNASSLTATLQPSSALQGGTKYTATVTTGAQGSDGTPLAANSSWSFTTAACPCSLFSPIVVPASTGLPTADGRSGTGPFSLELGVQIVPDETMDLTALRFYKSPGETGTHVGNVWTTNGVLLASTTFTGESASGWQQQSLPSPLVLQAGTTYVVSVNANAFFVDTPAGLATQVVSGPLRTAAVPANGVFATNGGAFPTQTYNSSNYFVDVLASPDAGVTAPTVASTTPAAGATGVSRTATVTATFSRAMDASTIDATDFTLTGPGGPVPATVTYDGASNTATLTPTAALAYSTTYTARVGTAVRARDGMPLGSATAWTFTVADPVRPQVTSTAPAAGSTDSGPSTLVRAIFSRALDPTTVTTSTFTLADGSTPVSGTVAYDSTSNTATFTPAAPLTAGHVYTATLAGTIAATDGATLGAPVSWSFTVAATLAPPTVVSFSPVDGATLAARAGAVTATFSRGMDPTTITTSTFTLAPAAGGAAVAATVTYDAASRTATLTPASLLAPTTQYRASVTAGAKATDGTPVTPASAAWTTAACPCNLFGTSTPALTGLSTTDGRSGGGPFTYELGVKVKVDVPTTISAIRFYKSAGETGTHVGRIWSATGTQLASTTFTGETASGWQQQALPAPYVMQPGNVYVVSVNANAFFSTTTSGLATSVASGPMHTVADGANGVFASSAGTFPTSSYSSSNYFVDLVGDPGAVSAPTVTSLVPADAATGVARTAAVKATFSRSMNGATVTSSTFTVTGPSGAVAGTVAYDDSTTTATFTPSAPLAYSTTYTAKIAGAWSLDGSPLATVTWSFTVVAAVPPTITAQLPAAGATDIGPTATPRATFSKDIDPTTLTASTFTLTGPSGAVAATVAYASATRTATLTPSAPLAAGLYTASLSGAVQATDQAPLAPTSWTFTVSSPAVAFAVTGRTPAAGATAVARDSAVSATFSRPLDPLTVTGATADIRDSSNAVVPATVSYDDPSRSITVTPSATLAPGATYTVEMTTGIHAADNTALPSPTTWTFTTDACPCSLFSAPFALSSTGNPTQDGRSGTGPFSLELGVKIQVDRPMQLTAIRFLKDAKETGTHVGTIWTAGGSFVASATFANETSSGWQQQALASPVSLQPGVTYVVSVGMNAYFGLTPAGLTTSVVNGPLHTVADGANGVFALAAGTFPTQSWNSSNYGIDVVVR